MLKSCLSFIKICWPKSNNILNDGILVFHSVKIGIQFRRYVVRRTGCFIHYLLSASHSFLILFKIFSHHQVLYISFVNENVRKAANFCSKRNNSRRQNSLHFWKVFSRHLYKTLLEAFQLILTRTLGPFTKLIRLNYFTLVPFLFTVRQNEILFWIKTIW